MNKTRSTTFTYIELLEVINIIMILATMLFQALSNARKRACGIHCVNSPKRHRPELAVYTDYHDVQLLSPCAAATGLPTSEYGSAVSALPSILLSNGYFTPY